MRQVRLYLHNSVGNKTIMIDVIYAKSIRKGSIERIRKNHKSHRNILDQDIDFIRNVLKELKIEHDVVKV